MGQGQQKPVISTLIVNISQTLISRRQVQCQAQLLLQPKMHRTTTQIMINLYTTCAKLYEIVRKMATLTEILSIKY